MNERIIEIILFVAISMTIISWVLLILIEKQIRKIKIKNRNEIYLERLEKEYEDSSEELENIDQISKEFFKEVFKLKKVEYSNLIDIFNKNNDKTGIEFCKLRKKNIYAEDEPNPNEVKVLKNYLIEIIKNNKIMSEEEEEKRIKSNKKSRFNGFFKNLTYKIKSTNIGAEEFKKSERHKWNNALNVMKTNKEMADKLISENYPLIRDVLKSLQQGKVTKKDITSLEMDALKKINYAKKLLDSTRITATYLFNKANKTENPEEKEYLKRLLKRFYSEVKISKNIKDQSLAIQNMMSGLEEYGKYKFALNRFKIK
jgi:hypothetical protein